VANRRLAMRQIKDILRLHWSQRLSIRSIARSLGVGYGSVHDVLQRAAAAGLCWPLPVALDDEALAQQLYRGNQGRPRRRAEPDWTVVDTELRRKGVTRELLWLEYKQAHPDDGLQYTQFCVHYKRWRQTQDVVLLLVLFEDLHWIDSETPSFFTKPERRPRSVRPIGRR